MLFSENIIETFESNPMHGLEEAVNIADFELGKFRQDQGWTNEEHEILWEACSFLDQAIKEYDIDYNMHLPEPSNNVYENCGALSSYFNDIKSFIEVYKNKESVDEYKSRYKTFFKSAFYYEFTQGDLDKIQFLINELREKISVLEGIEPSHKQRLLRRLEKLQSELHKKVSDLDRFWGLVGEAGVALGKFGSDSKPIVDRIKEISQIVWNTQSRAEELPSNSENPMIELDD